MKTINTKNQIQRVTKLIATSALVAVPFLSVLPAVEAQPRWNNGNQGGWNNSPTTTLTGVVTRDLAGDYFELRTDSGRTIRVNVGRYDEPRSLDRGDRVRVTGYTRNGVFTARNIEFIRDTGNGNWQNSLTGVVTRDLGGNSFQLSTDNGRSVHVTLIRQREPRSLDRGDRVRVEGRFDGSLFRATEIQFIRDTGNGGGWGNNQQTTSLTGTVNRDLVGDSFELRTDSGRTLWVRLERGREARSLNRGDRVRVTGRFSNNTFIARDLDFLRDRR